jgi:hypothetical protein
MYVENAALWFKKTYNRPVEVAQIEVRVISGNTWVKRDLLVGSAVIVD